MSDFVQFLITNQQPVPPPNFKDELWSKLETRFQLPFGYGWQGHWQLITAGSLSLGIVTIIGFNIVHQRQQTLFINSLDQDLAILEQEVNSPDLLIETVEAPL